MKNNSNLNKQLLQYKNLIIIILLIIISSIAITKSQRYASYNDFMRYFMGLFFVIFSMFKLFDIESFSRGFIKYDLLSQNIRYYSFIYPFIELILGIGYLSNYNLYLINLICLFITSIGTYSIIKSIRQKSITKCACLGNILNVPIGIVTIIENSLMSVMSLIMLIF